MLGNDWWNKNVFSWRRKEETDGADCMSSGRVFQKMEAATGNERQPAVIDRRYGGMCSCSVNDDRRRRRPGRLDTGKSWFRDGVAPNHSTLGMSWALVDHSHSHIDKLYAGLRHIDYFTAKPNIHSFILFHRTQVTNKTTWKINVLRV